MCGCKEIDHDRGIRQHGPVRGGGVNCEVGTSNLVCAKFCARCVSVEC